MLLELLDHHQELFLAAIEPLICGNKRSLCALAATCKRLRTLINTIDIYVHYIKYWRVLTLYPIHKVIFDNNVSTLSIIYHNNKIMVYSIINDASSMGDLTVHSKNLKINKNTQYKIIIHRNNTCVYRIDDIVLPLSLNLS